MELALEQLHDIRPDWARSQGKGFDLGYLGLGHQEIAIRGRRLEGHVRHLHHTVYKYNQPHGNRGRVESLF